MSSSNRQVGPLTATSRAYLFFLAAFVPLAVSRGGDPHDVDKRLRATARAVPELAHVLSHGSASPAEIFAAIPDHKLIGAHLPYGSFVPWLYAVVAAAAYFVVVRVLFPSPARWRELLGAAAFTATVGMVLLLGFQFVAGYSQGIWLQGFNVAVLLFYVVKLIGFSYRAALDPDNGFLLSFVGFTAGVGFCEELTKALPILWRVRKRELTAAEACAWGLASGVGFGVAEGIHYASSYYDGYSPWTTYVVRFVSCVALHATWSGAVGYTLHESRDRIRAPRRPIEWLVLLARLLFVPMVLHGLYDTLLKRDMDGVALVIAIVSFVWLGGAIEKGRRSEGCIAPAACEPGQESD
jgi:RsiW-degrading membrane proteinase PrsW (M82 family)